MSKRSILAGLALVLTLAGCASPGGQVAYTGPGWYLERPRLLLVTGPEIFAGPFTYEGCELERMKWETANRLLCINEKAPPGRYGPYDRPVPAPPAPG
jgi:hypothetical protein